MSEESETDLSSWEQAPTKKMISYSFGILISSWIGGAFAVFVFYYYEVEITCRPVGFCIYYICYMEHGE